MNLSIKAGVLPPQSCALALLFLRATLTLLDLDETWQNCTKRERKDLVQSRIPLPLTQHGFSGEGRAASSQHGFSGEGRAASSQHGFSGEGRAASSPQ